MCLYKTKEGSVRHADAIPEIVVVHRRQAESAFSEVIDELTDEQIEKMSDRLSMLRDFIISR